MQKCKDNNIMSFKQFVSWCNSRAADGCWGYKEATLCIAIIDEVNSQKFYKREKIWKDTLANDIISKIVNPINEKIKLNIAI